MTSLNQLIDFGSTLCWKTQDLLAEVGELGLVAKNGLILQLEVTLDSRQVVFIHADGLLFAHSLELNPIVLLVGLILLMFLHLTILLEAFIKTVLVFVDAIEGPWRPRHIIFAGDVCFVL